MQEAILNAVNTLPAWLQVMVVAALPIIEFQGAVPFALQVHGFSLFETLILTTIGNMAPFFPLYFGLVWVRHRLERYAPRLMRPLDAFIARADKKLRDHFERYGAIGLFIFVAVPLSLTGVWTATVGAVSLKIPFKESFVSFTLGVIIGALGVALITKGVVGLIF